MSNFEVDPNGYLHLELRICGLLIDITSDSRYDDEEGYFRLWLYKETELGFNSIVLHLGDSSYFSYYINGHHKQIGS